uniref:C2H2-type domain-containing protein n=1 Tax=Timema douglasi TaxID=61478 RepID=A0A7R8VD74_TIMDO|nr:unnamed protein product [Timema douglasi]
MMQDLRTRWCIASEQLRDPSKYSLHGKLIRSVPIEHNAFSESERLRPHIAKHGSGALSPPMPKRDPEDNNNEEGSDFTSNSGLMFAAPPGMHPHPPSLTINGILDHHSSVTSDDSNLNKRSRSPQHAPITLDMSPEAKKARVQNSMRILKDEPVPEGYVRFRFNEDCKYPHCGYREHQTHFHCMRLDCGYSFCDKTRFVQHTARHERLDTLMGGDFQQFRANVSCGRQECVHTTTLGTMQNKASHFHCLKCEFVCTDTNKVVAHRRQHQKLDSIMAAGFEKFTPTQPCNQDSCAHSGKQTHYHCLSCQYAVLGLSQMSAHKYRHMD